MPLFASDNKAKEDLAFSIKIDSKTINMKQKLILFALFITGSTGLFAQTIERQVIGSTGGYSAQSNVSASFTVGETVTKTATAGTIILTQGFQQTDVQTVGIEDVSNNIKVSAYPNPTTGKVTVEVHTGEANTFNLMVYNSLGQVVLLPSSGNQTNSSMRYEFDFSPLAAANYFLVIKSGANSFDKTIQINKTN